MLATPRSLVDFCIDAYIEILEDRLDHSLKSVPRNYFIPNPLSERILTVLCERNKLSDFNIGVFEANHTRLRRVKLPKADLLTRRGLRVLKDHTITDLEVINLQVTVNELILSLGEKTLSNLKSLNVTKCSFWEHDNQRVCVVVALSKLKNLRCLNVSFTGFNTHGLEIVCEDLIHLEVLDISSTEVKDISPLKKCKNRLKSLALYNLKISNHSVIAVILELTELRHLDWSDIKFHLNPFELFMRKCEVISELGALRRLPHLVSLDVSGKDGVNAKMIEEFLESHPNAKFLGLLYSDAACNDRFVDHLHAQYNPELIITGTACEAQMLEGLKRYWNRPQYVQKILYNLFRLTPTFSTTPRADIINLIVKCMKPYPMEFGVQMAATACLYNLTRGELAVKIHPGVLQDVVECTLTAMENFPNHFQLQKNTLLTLCSDRILQDVSFDRYRCARLVLSCLCNFDDPSMNRMSVGICSILAAKICTNETHLLGAHPVFMKKLLDIVKTKVESETVDITLKLTLSALWNLTDESPVTCRVFLQEGGLDLFQKVLQVFQDQATIESKVLGLINNIAEVKELRPSLMIPAFILLLRKLLLVSAHLDVSYFAAGIIAHLASDGSQHWVTKDRNSIISRNTILNDLERVVLNWGIPDGEMVAYRSFKPFYPLLMCYEDYPVQLWAVWAIHHVCAKNGKKYLPMLVQDGVISTIEDIYNNYHANDAVKQICAAILEEVK